MVDVLHRVKVFVYRFGDLHPDYLLLRRPGYESFWGPVQSRLELGEKLETATQRSVMHDLGIGRPVELHDLQCPARWILGDEQVIEWNFGYRAPSAEPDVQLDPGWADFRWADITDAYPALELDADRTAILRLHAILSAA
jgi:hypothetical protein